MHYSLKLLLIYLKLLLMYLIQSSLKFLGFRDQDVFECQIPRDEKVVFFSQGTDGSKNLKHDTLYIADYG